MNIEGVSTSIQSLLPKIRGRCGEIEQARRIPGDLAEELRKTEIFSLGVPRAIGGKEATPIDIMRAIRLEQRGYRIWTQRISAAVTPKNRLLLGSPVP